MRSKYLVLNLLAIFVLSSCNYSFSKGNDVKFKKKSINGVDYMFFNNIEYKKIHLNFLRQVQFKNKISFYGSGETIEMEISKSDFEKKMNSSKIYSLHIDSVSFTINDKGNKIDLIYYLNLNNENKLLKFNLNKDTNSWKLN
jgi:uncharacterized protein YhbP (UPF0306 family)